VEAQRFLSPTDRDGITIQLPAPTAWPCVLAFGLTLVFAGVVTNAGVSLLGATLAIAACVGWFRQVFPHEAHVAVLAQPMEVDAVTSCALVTQVQLGGAHRAHLPIETPPMIAGIKGGIAGGIVMVLPALLYGYLTQHSIWYAVNLLGGAGVGHWTNPTTADIAAFHWNGLIMATIIHTVTSLLIGLLYGAMLPMFPRRPILFGGFIAPLIWTGLLHSMMGIVNPAWNARISWGWFAVSELLFGIAAGLVVTKAEHIRTNQSYSFLVRMGIEAPGVIEPKGDEKEN
jgi:hypothetical protein